MGKDLAKDAGTRKRMRKYFGSVLKYRIDVVYLPTLLYSDVKFYSSFPPSSKTPPDETLLEKKH